MKEKMSEGEFQQFVVEQFGKVGEQFTNVDQQLGLIRDEIQAMRSDIREIQGTLRPLVEAFDKDAQTLVEHDRRVERLETHIGIRRST